MAVEFDGQEYTYGEIKLASVAIKARIRENTAAQRPVVAIFCNRSPELIACMLAVLAANGSFCVFDPTYPDIRLRQMLDVLGADLLIHVGDASSSNGFMQSVKSDTRVKLLKIDSVQEMLCVGLEYDLNEALVERGPEKVAQGGYYLFTSGTTGIPKAIYTDLIPLCHFLGWYSSSFGFGENDRFSMLSGLGHDPILRDVFAPLWTGGRLCIPPREILISPRRLLSWLIEARVSVSHITPQLTRMLVAEAQRDKSSSPGVFLPDLRYTFFGGDALFHDDLEAWKAIAPNTRFVNFYGATETPQAVSFFVVPDKKDGSGGGQKTSRVPIGKGIADTEILVLRKDMRAAAVGEAGEIFVKTAFLSLGYVGDEEATALRFIRDSNSDRPDVPMYRTGDRGLYLDDGGVVHLGRLDDQVKIRGFRVEMAEVQAQLIKCAAVLNAVVLAVENPRIGTELVAFVVPRRAHGSPRVDRASLSSDGLRQALLQQLPDYMVPSRIIFLDQMPIGPNGKADKAQLEALIQSRGKDRHETESIADGSVEGAFTACWKKWFPDADITMDSHFLFLGGNSLMAVQMAVEIEEETGLRIDPPVFFRELTLGRICEQAKLLQKTEKKANEMTDSDKGVRQRETQTEILGKLRSAKERWRKLEAEGPAKAPRRAVPYAMRRSLLARLLLAPLYRTTGSTIREILTKLILKLEGGAWFSLTLRELYRSVHRMEIGHYSSYCFSVSNFKPGTRFGRYCDITRTARFETANHPMNTVSSHGIFYQRDLGFSSGVVIPRQSIEIGNDVHIGHNAMILYPVKRIGDGAIIAAGAVVNADVPPYAVVAGYPARIVRYRFPEPIIRALLEIRWWELPLEALEEVRDVFEKPIDGDSIK